MCFSATARVRLRDFQEEEVEADCDQHAKKQYLRSVVSVYLVEILLSVGESQSTVTRGLSATEQPFRPNNPVKLRDNGIKEHHVELVHAEAGCIEKPARSAGCFGYPYPQDITRPVNDDRSEAFYTFESAYLLIMHCSETLEADLCDRRICPTCFRSEDRSTTSFAPTELTAFASVSPSHLLT